MSDALNPTDDLPSVDTDLCDCCSEPWAWEADRAHGPRKLRLCEDHADRWLAGEDALNAELMATREELRGRGPSVAAFYGLARAFDGRTRKAV